VLKNAYDKNSQTPNPETFNGQNADNDTRGATPARAGNEPLRFVAPTHGGVDILKLLTELEDLVEHTKHGPLGSLWRFDEDKFHMTIMKIRANLPEEMKRASKLARDSERIVEETRENAERVVGDARKAALVEIERSKSDAVRVREEARAEIDRMRQAAEREAQHIQEQARQAGVEIVAEAHAQAEQLVSDSEIIQQALLKAQDLQMRAEEEAAAVRRGADDYARDVLANMETVLDKAVGQIQRGREMLERAP
jgi:hypothetical protein